MSLNHAPIGIFDSGMGGISVLAEAIRQLESERFIYIGDSKNAPYGVKTVNEIKELSFNICDQLVKRNVKAIIVACNTATSAAILDLRDKYDIPIIGMEPALKPAVIENMNGNVVVLATDVTLREEKFFKLAERFQDNANIISIPSPSLVELVECGILDGEKAEKVIRDIFSKVNIETLSAVVLGCTHFVFLKNTISKVLGEKVKIYDGNDGTIRQLARILSDGEMLLEDLSNQELALMSAKSLEHAIIENTLSDEMIDRSRHLALYYLMNIKNKHHEKNSIKNKERETVEDKLRQKVEKYLVEIIENNKLSDQEEKLLRLRYGLENVNRATFEELLKLMNIRKPEDLKKSIQSLDRKLFNYIKNKVL